MVVTFIRLAGQMNLTVNSYHSGHVSSSGSITGLKRIFSDVEVKKPVRTVSHWRPKNKDIVLTASCSEAEAEAEHREIGTQGTEKGMVHECKKMFPNLTITYWAQQGAEDYWPLTIGSREKVRGIAPVDTEAAARPQVVGQPPVNRTATRSARPE
ncbi:hypothetical protein J6590_016980 [Homalodisca vitripennis]|nr:hypothetical protein J6590_016980 [Homalodisca vitripennis]